MARKLRNIKRINSPLSPFIRGGLRGITCLLSLTLSLLLSCSSEKTDTSKQKIEELGGVQSQTSQAGGSSTRSAYSMEIVPLNATKSSRLYAVPHGFELSDAEVEWFINGEKAAQAHTPEFDASITRKNDSIQARATVDGQKVGGDVRQG